MPGNFLLAHAFTTKAIKIRKKSLVNGLLNGNDLTVVTLNKQ